MIRKNTRKIAVIAALLILGCMGCGAESKTETNEIQKDSVEQTEINKTNEDVDTEAAKHYEITVKTELAQYKDMTYEQYKKMTGADLESIRSEVFGGMIPDTNLTIIFLASHFDMDTWYQMQEQDKCYRLEGTLESLVDGVTEEMTIDEFIKGLSNGGQIPEFAFGEGYSAAYRISDLYVATIFDSNGDGENDAILHVAIMEEDSIKPESVAWLFFGVADDYVNM